MNKEHGITRENLLYTFPRALERDKSLSAFADAAARILELRGKEADTPRIFPNVDRLDEAVLDILAYDLKVDWYNYDYPLQIKRELIKRSVLVHKQMGTVYATKSVLSSMHLDYDLEEWFAYNGTPGCFRLNINISGDAEAGTEVYSVPEILRRIAPVKRLSAHLEGVSYTFRAPPSILHVGGGIGSVTQLGIRNREDAYDFRHTLYVGGTGGIRAESRIPEKPDDPKLTETLRIGGNSEIHSELALPEDTAPPSFSVIRTGGVCTIISNISGED